MRGVVRGTDVCPEVTTEGEKFGYLAAIVSGFVGDLSNITSFRFIQLP